ncbi:hypothetical protein ZWY2020_045666 [Hordeum vulgare]|nr:hypothetical protein ZWY2020_045666 [Hordeum vulgare]
MGEHGNLIRHSFWVLMAVFRNNGVVAVWLGALMLMATLLSSEAKPTYIGCFAAKQNCFPDECQKTCEDNVGRDTLGDCHRERDHNKPYPGLECCCFRKDTPAPTNDR